MEVGSKESINIAAINKVEESRDWRRGTDFHQQSMFDVTDEEIDWEKQHVLQLIDTTNEKQPETPVIPASIFEMMSYLRINVVSPARTELLCIQWQSFNTHVWYTCFNKLMKTFPSAFIHIFFGNYSPQHCLYITEISHWLCGLNVLIILSAMLELMVVNDYCMLLMEYLRNGLISKHPWKRYENTNMTYKVDNVTYVCTCYSAPMFIEKTQNFTNFFYVFFYYYEHEPKEACFQLSFCCYLQSTLISMIKLEKLFALYCILFWTIAFCFYKGLSNKFLWKVHAISECIFNICLFFMLIHITVYYERDINIKLKPLQTDLQAFSKWVHLPMENMVILFESMCAPPVLKILASNSTKNLNPTRFSIFHALNGMVYMVLRGYFRTHNRDFARGMVGVKVYYHFLNPLTCFLLLPMYFSTIKLGHILSVVTFTLMLIVEMCNVILTSQMLIEVIIRETKIENRLTVTTVLFITPVLIPLFFNYEIRITLHVLLRCLPMCFEILILYFLYPFGRFMDDIIFHFGVPIPYLVKIVLRLMPFYYLILIVFYLVQLVDFMPFITLNTLAYGYDHHAQSKLRPIVYFTIFTLFCGFLYFFFVNVVKEKKNCNVLLCPRKSWGPKDFDTRQLRKIYDSREYITSKVPRILSRYMIKKGKSDVYQIGIPYDSVLRRRSDMDDQEEKANIIKKKTAEEKNEKEVVEYLKERDMKKEA